MSSFLCCTIRRPPWQRAPKARPNEMIVKANLPMKKHAVGALRLSSGSGVSDLGTGVLIHESLVLTSHMNLPSKQGAENGEFVLTDRYAEPSSYRPPPPCERSSRILTRKLLPTRCFLTNPSLGVTMVGCDPVSFEMPLHIETAKVPGEILTVGRSIYVLGHIEHDDKRRGLVMFGEGRISSEDEQVIEFYSLDGKVWAPGSAGFDEQGNFAFMVGDSKSPSGAKFGVSSMQKRFQSEKDSVPKQLGILVYFVREWIRTMWDWGTDDLIKKKPSVVSTVLPVSSTKEFGTDPIPPTDSVPNTLHQLLNGCEGATAEVADLHMQSYPREDLTVRENCAAVDCSFASVGSQMQDCTSSDKSAYVSVSGFPSNLGGTADLAATELTMKRLAEPNPEEKFSRAIDGDKCSITRNDFMTGVVKVRYFNKNIFLPDRMPVADNPKQDPNGGSWYNWGKRAPTSRPLSPKETASAACGDLLDVRLEFPSNPQGIIPICKAPDPIKDRETSRDSGLQPLRPEIFTSVPETNTSQCKMLRVDDARLGDVLSDCHPRSLRIPPPELSSPVSHSKRPFKPILHQVVNPPRDLGFGLMSTTSPRSPNKAKAGPWKPPGSNGTGSPLQNLKFVSEKRQVTPVGYPRRGAPRSFRGLRKRIYDLTMSAEARTVRKRREREQTGKPRWSAHSRVQKQDDNRKLAALPPRVVKPGEFPAKLFSSHLSGSAQLCKGNTAGSRKGKKADVTKVQKLQADTRSNVVNIDSRRKYTHSSQIQNPLASQKSTVLEVGKKTRWSSSTALRLISKYKEKDCPKLRVKGFLVSSTSWIPKFPAERTKKCEQQSSSKRTRKAASSKHARKGLEPPPSKIHAHTDIKTDDRQISCQHSPKETVVSTAFQKPIALAEGKEKVTPSESPGRSTRHEQPVGDASQEVDSKMICSGIVDITEKKSEQGKGLACWQYWKKFFTERKDPAAESTEALLSPKAAAHTEQHTPTVPCSPASPIPFWQVREGTDDKHDSKYYFDIHHQSQTPRRRKTPLQAHINSELVFESPPALRHNSEAKVVKREEGDCSPRIRPACFSSIPSIAAASDSLVDGEMTASHHKFLPTPTTAVPEKGQPAMSSGPGRPRLSVARVDGRPEMTTRAYLVSPRDAETSIMESGGKGRMISSLDVELEALIFQSENEKAPTSSKTSGVLGLPKQKLDRRDAAAFCPHKSACGMGSRTALPSRKKRARKTTTPKHSGGRDRTLAKIYTAELGTNLVSSPSEDGSSARSDGRIPPTPGTGRVAHHAADQPGKSEPLWRP